MSTPQPGPREASDERLLAEFLAGDEEAFATLVQRYATDLYQFVARFVRNAAAAEDVVQETFVQVYQSAPGFDPSRRLRPWLFTIAANKARDHLRSRGRKKEVSLSTAAAPHFGDEVTYLDFIADAGAGPTEAIEADELQEVVQEIVSDMPEHLREILILGYYQRLPYKEIAEVLAIPLGTVKSRLHAAVSYFAACYRKREEDPDAEPDD